MKAKYTRSQLLVLQRLTEFKSNDEIASSLYLSLEAVRSHLKNLYKITKAGSREELVRIAFNVTRKE